MIRRVQLRSLAKINLDLRVLHKRTDGFHELRTVFQTISLADNLRIEFEPARKTDLTLDDPLVIADNLVLKAARRVMDAMSVHGRVRFSLEKKIPMGGGLGGGSSNAAAVLLALPFLARKPLPMSLLNEIGRDLGSDVPFFLNGGTSLGIGRGTELYDLPELAPQAILLFLPGVHVSTAEAYGGLGRSLTEADSSSRINSFREYVQALCQGRSAGVAGNRSRNDFEEVAFRLYPQLKLLAGRVRKCGSVTSRMTGSGSTFFALFESRAARDQVGRAWAAKKSNCPVIAAELVSRSRYQALWRRQLSESGLKLDSKNTWPPHS